MRHVNYCLTPAAINAAKPKDKPYSLTDGGGLHIEVLTSGARTWRFKYHLNGKRGKVTIGSWPQISIKAARDEHERLRELVEKGVDPAREKRDAAEQQAIAAASTITFQEYATAWVRETMFHRSVEYRRQRVAWLDNLVYPVIGQMELGAVMPRHVLKIIEAKRATPATADAVRVMIQQIFNHAIRNLKADTNPATPLRGAIVKPPVEHYRHLSERELAAFLKVLGHQGAHATTILATRLLLLTMLRKTELIHARWHEVDLEAALLDIPKERMKKRRPHRVYLSRQAVQLFREVYALTGHGGPDGYVFPSIYKGAKVPMASATINHFFDRMDFGVPDFCPHGLRGTAATLLREHGFDEDVVELLLAHKEQDRTKAAYSHHELPEERRAALQYLADFVDKLVDGERTDQRAA